MIFSLAYADPKSEHVTDVVAVDESCTSRNGTAIRSRTHLHHQALVLAHRTIYVANREYAT